MSISFTLKGNFLATAVAVREQVTDLLGDSAVSREDFLVVPDSLSVGVGTPDAEDIALTMELYGLHEKTDVYFTLFKSNLDTGNIQMWNIVLHLLDENPGDVLLLYNGEMVVLLRRGGKVILNQDWAWDFEPDWLMSRLPVDLKMESIPVD